MRAAATARAATSGCTSSVTSVAVPPVLRLALLRSTTRRPFSGTSSGDRPCTPSRASAISSRRIRVSGGGMAVAAPRIGVDRVDQLAHRVHAVADHVRRIAPRRGDQPCRRRPAAGSRGRAGTARPSPRRSRRRRGRRSSRCSRRHDVDRDALALVAVLRLDDHRQADLQRHGPGLVGVSTDRPIGTGTPAACSRCLVRSLSWAIASRHGAGAVDLGGPDAALLRAPAELHQAAFGQPAHTGCRGPAPPSTMAPVLGPRRTSSSMLAQLGHRGGDVEGLPSIAACQQLARQGQRAPADLLFGVFDDDLVDAGFRRRGRPAERHRAAGLRLQRQRQPLQQAGVRQLDWRHQRRAARPARGTARAGAAPAARCAPPRSLRQHSARWLRSPCVGSTGSGRAARGCG